MFDPEDESIPSGESRSFEESELISGSDGWITPGGKFYSCTPEEHDTCASFLLENRKDEIQKALKQNKSNRQNQIDSLPPRVILKAAGYALFSHGILAEQNLPKDLSLEQIKKISDANLKFTPESGRIEPNLYLEFQKTLSANEELSNLMEVFGYEGREGITNWIANPSTILYLSDWMDSRGARTALEVYDLITRGYSSEYKFGEAINHGDQFIWRKVSLASGGDIYIQMNEHEHDAFQDYVGDHDYLISLVSLDQIKEFLQTEAIPELE